MIQFFSFNLETEKTASSDLTTISHVLLERYKEVRGI